MKTLASFLIILFSACLSLLAHPTGAALYSFPVIPCRILDTRVSLGALQANTAMDVHVRGSALLSSEGAGISDCDVPPKAEAVMVNVTVVSPSSTGHLKINGYGEVAGPHGIYSRFNYRPFENDSNEMQIDLCNIFLFPAPHEPCGFDGFRYNDFQVLNVATAGSLHIVMDVVGYLARE